MTLLLESEVATRLRCSKSTVKRLRRAGKLPFAPGRPVKFRSEDVDAYVERLFCQKTPPNEQQRTNEEIAARARLAVLKRRLKGR